MKASPESIFERIFKSRSEPAARAIVESKPVQDLLAQIDGEEVKRRAALRKELDALPAKHEKICSEATQAAETARKKREAAIEELNRATAAHFEAVGRSYGLHLARDGEERRIRRELEASADVRIEPMRIAFLSLESEAHCKVPDLVTSRDGVQHDASRIGNALVALRRALAALDALRYEALPRDQVTAELRRIVKALEPVLSVIGLKAPAVDADELPATLH